MAPPIGQMHQTRSGLALLSILALAATSALAPAAPKPKLEPAPIVYEVATAGNDQKKLRLIFAAVNEANGGTLSKEEFLRRLKSREHFEIKFPVRCRVCRRWKRLIPDRGVRGTDRVCGRHGARGGGPGRGDGRRGGILLVGGGVLGRWAEKSRHAAPTPSSTRRRRGGVEISQRGDDGRQAAAEAALGLRLLATVQVVGELRLLVFGFGD